MVPVSRGPVWSLHTGSGLFGVLDILKHKPKKMKRKKTRRVYLFNDKSRHVRKIQDDES